MKYILDTNAVSALMKGVPAAVDRLADLDRSAVSVPQPVLAEIAYGIERLPRSRRRTELRRRLSLIRNEIGRAEWSDAVSDAFGRIKAMLERQGRRIADFDAAIAAHAVAAGATLITADNAHMARVPDLMVEDWLR